MTEDDAHHHYRRSPIRRMRWPSSTALWKKISRTIDEKNFSKG